MPKHTTRPESGRPSLQGHLSPRRVLVIRIGRLGDTVMATAVIEPLRKSFGSDVLIDFVVSPGASQVILSMDRRINRVFPIAHRRIPWRIHTLKRALGKLSRSTPYDLVINLECGPQCDDFIKFIHAREFIGRPQFQTRHIPGRHCIDTEKTIYADALGVAATVAAGPLLKLLPDPNTLPIGINGDCVVLNPGFSGIQKQGYRSHRSWPVEHWVKLIELIRQHTGLAVYINGTQEESPFFHSLLEMPGVHSLFGSTLPALIRALEGARCLISVDTGTMHLATALGIPVIALFGPSNSELTGPYSQEAPCKVLTSGLDCQPCYGTTLQRQCTSNRCMQMLRPEDVYGAFEKIDLARP
jgi:ADP-heptose:LPS heptosyltransferase